MKIWPAGGSKDPIIVNRAIIGKKEYRNLYFFRYNIMPGPAIELHVQFPKNKFNMGHTIAYVDFETVFFGDTELLLNSWDSTYGKKIPPDMDVIIEWFPDKKYYPDRYRQFGRFTVKDGIFGNYSWGFKPEYGGSLLRLPCECLLDPDATWKGAAAWYAAMYYKYIIRLSGRFPWYNIVPNIEGAIANYVEDRDEDSYHQTDFYLGEVLTSVKVSSISPIYCFPCCDGKAFSCTTGKLASIEGDLFNGLENGPGYSSYFRGFFAGQGNLSIDQIPTSILRYIYKDGETYSSEEERRDFSYFFYGCAGGPKRSSLGTEYKVEGFNPIYDNDADYFNRYMGVLYNRYLTAGETMDKPLLDAEFGVTPIGTKEGSVRPNKTVGFYRKCANPGVIFVSSSDCSEYFADSGLSSFPNFSGVSSGDFSYMYSNCKNLKGSPPASCVPAGSGKYQGLFQGCENISCPGADFAARLLPKGGEDKLNVSGMFANSGVKNLNTGFTRALFSYEGPITAVSMFYNTKIQQAGEEFWGSVPDREDVNVNRIFGNCTELTYAYPIWDKFENISASGAYEYCANASNKNDIPDEYWEYNLELWRKKQSEKSKS